MKANRLMMKSAAPTIIIEGVLQEALSQVTQHQVQMRLQIVQAKTNEMILGLINKIAQMEAQMVKMGGGKLILPS